MGRVVMPLAIFLDNLCILGVFCLHGIYMHFNCVNYDAHCIIISLKSTYTSRALYLVV